MKYCPECARKLEARRIDGIERLSCGAPNCGFVHWENPTPVVAAVVEYRNRIVLARNASWPDDVFSLVTGYLERNETPQQAVVREVKEELGLDSKTLGLIGCYALFEKNQVILAHWVVATGEIKTGNELSAVKLLSREELGSWQFGRLALTSEIVREWLEQTNSTNKALNNVDAANSAVPHSAEVGDEDSGHGDSW